MSKGGWQQTKEQRLSPQPLLSPHAVSSFTWSEGAFAVVEAGVDRAVRRVIVGLELASTNRGDAHFESHEAGRRRNRHVLVILVDADAVHTTVLAGYARCRASVDWRHNLKENSNDDFLNSFDRNHLTSQRGWIVQELAVIFHYYFATCYSASRIKLRHNFFYFRNPFVDNVRERFKSYSP